MCYILLYTFAQACIPSESALKAYIQLVTGGRYKHLAPDRLMQYTDVLVDCAKKKVQSMVNYNLSQNLPLHLMADSWSWKRIALFAVMVTGLVDAGPVGPVMKTMVLSLVDASRFSQTGDWLAQQIQDALNSVQLTVPQVGSVTSDAASNLAAAYRKLGLKKWWHCACHSLHLSVMRFLKYHAPPILVTPHKCHFWLGPKGRGFFLAWFPRKYIRKNDPPMQDTPP